jgi:hypothetical protein
MPGSRQPATQFRLAELLGALSLVADLGMGHAPEETVSACFLASQLARILGISEPEVRDICERILSCSPVLAPLGALAGMHHERLDGSGVSPGVDSGHGCHQPAGGC